MANSGLSLAFLSKLGQNLQVSRYGLLLDNVFSKSPYLVDSLDIKSLLDF
jgi:hypothetical protein